MLVDDFVIAIYGLVDNVVLWLNKAGENIVFFILDVAFDMFMKMVSKNEK